MPTSALLYGLYSVALLAAPLNAALTGRLGPPDAESERIIKALQTTALRLLRTSSRECILVLLVLCTSSLSHSYFSNGSLLPAFFAPLIGALLVSLSSFWWLSRVFIAAAQEVSAKSSFEPLSFRSRAAGLATLPIVGAFGLACLSTLSLSDNNEQSTELLVSLAGGGIGIGLVLCRAVLLVKGGVPREISPHLTDPTTLVRSAADLAFSAIRSSTLQLAAFALVLGASQQVESGAHANELRLLAAIGPLLAVIGSLITGASHPQKVRQSWFATSSILVVLAIIASWRFSPPSNGNSIIAISTGALGLSVMTHLLPLLRESRSTGDARSRFSHLSWSLAPLCIVICYYRLVATTDSIGNLDSLLAASLATAALIFLPWAYLGRTVQILTTLHPALQTMRGNSAEVVHDKTIDFNQSALSGLPLFLLVVTTLVASLGIVAVNTVSFPSAFASASLVTAIFAAAAGSLSLRLFKQQAQLLEQNSRSSLEYQHNVQFQGSLSPDLSAPLSASLRAQKEPAYGYIVLLLLPALIGNILQALGLAPMSYVLSVAGVSAGSMLIFLAWFFNATPWRVRLSSQLLTLIGMHFILWIPMVAQHS